MKRILVFLLVCILTANLAACNNSPVTGSDSTSDSASVKDTTSTKDTSTDEQETTLPDAAGTVWKVPTYDIYATYPEGWMAVENGGVLMVMKSKEAMVSITYSLDETIGNDLEKAISPTTRKIVDNVYSYCEGRIANSEVEVASTAECKVGEFDCLKFNGSISSSGEYDCHVYGYTYIIDGVSIVVCGMVTAKAQDNQLIAEIDALTDQIANTIRTQK